jgi:hypothetical protein
MIIIRPLKKHAFSEGRRPKNYWDYIHDRWNSDAEFDFFFNIFDGAPYQNDLFINQAVQGLKKFFPSVPNDYLKRYASIWWEHHKNIMN